MSTKITNEDKITRTPDGTLCLAVMDARSGEVLFDHIAESNVVVNDAKEALINSQISTSPSYRLDRIIAGNDIGDGVSAHHIVELSGSVATGDPTGLANDTTTYSIDYNYNNTISTISLEGQNAQTYGDLVSILDTQVSNGAVTLNTDGNIEMTADSPDPEELLFFDTATDALFNQLNDFSQFSDAINESNPMSATVDHTHDTLINNSTLVYDPEDYSNPEPASFGTRGTTEIIMNKVLRGEKVLTDLGYTTNQSIKFTSMCILTGNDKAFAYKRFSRLSISATVDINVVWYISYP